MKPFRSRPDLNDKGREKLVELVTNIYRRWEKTLPENHPEMIKLRAVAKAAGIDIRPPGLF